MPRAGQAGYSTIVVVWFGVVANQCFNTTLTELGLSTVFLTVEKNILSRVGASGVQAPDSGETEV
jgi:hypothetical protein